MCFPCLNRNQLVLFLILIDAILFVLDFSFEVMNSLAEGLNSLMITIAFPQQLVGQCVDALHKGMVLFGSCLLLVLQFVLESLNGWGELKFPILAILPMLPLFSDQILNFRVLFVQQPLQLLDLIQQQVHFSAQFRFQGCCVFQVMVWILGLDFLYIRLVQLLQLCHSFPQPIVLKTQWSHLILEPRSQFPILIKLSLELCSLVVVCSWKFLYFVLQNHYLGSVILL